MRRCLEFFVKQKAVAQSMDKFLFERKELPHRLFDSFLTFAEQELKLPKDCFSAVKKRQGAFC